MAGCASVAHSGSVNSTDHSGGPQASTPPKFKVSLSTPEAQDGSLMVLLIESMPIDATATAEFEGVFHSFFADEPAAAAPVVTSAQRSTASALTARASLMHEALIGIPYGHRPGPATIRVQIKDSAGMLLHETSLPFQIVDGKYHVDHLRVDPRKVNPKKSDMRRILREKSEVGVLYSQLTPKKLWHGPFAFPVKDSVVTGPYGNRRVFNGETRSYHGGLDMRAPTGTPIYAPAAGTVVMAKDLFFTGNTVILDHGHGLITLYAHLSKLNVKKGGVVQAQDLLGWSGATGRASGPHLHWQVMVNKVKVNPIELTRVLR